MKKTNYILPILIVIGISFGFQTTNPHSPCAVAGDNANPKFQHLDSLKNRSVISDKINSSITFDAIMATGDDTKRWSVNDCADITAYVYDVKWGGQESCECGDATKSQLDIHIELVKDLKNAGGTKRMVVEINRFFRASDKSLDYDVVKLLKGKKVEVKGYIFEDIEHKQNALNTSPQGTNLWRATIIELHPVFYIKEIK